VENRKVSLNTGLDGLSVLLYMALVLFGVVNIFAAEYDATSTKSFLDISLSSTRQIIFIGTSLVLILVILTIDYSLFDTYAFLFYVGAIFLLLLVLLFGKEIKGNRSWIAIGSFTLQPSEFAKIGTALALSKYLTIPPQHTNIGSPLRSIMLGVGIPPFLIPKQETLYYAGFILAIPVALIGLQGDAGSAMVFSVFALVLYREGFLPSWAIFGTLFLIIVFVFALFIPQEHIVYYLVIPILTLALVILLTLKKRDNTQVVLILGLATFLVIYAVSSKYIFENILKPHQKNRIMVLIDKDIDPSAQGIRYNLKHSLVAIGSGGLSGKGFLKGTQTKLNYVPEQTTDFIFCTVGEEYGWLGSAIMIFTFLFLLNRLVTLAERQQDKFARIYGYCVASILFFHFMINLAMTLGLFPVVGIPLPFLSYGGSSLWAFTILLFIFLKMDSHREQQMKRS
jgi:rod shape determining protein RodA